MLHSSSRRYSPFIKLCVRASFSLTAPSACAVSSITCQVCRGIVICKTQSTPRLALQRKPKLWVLIYRLTFVNRANLLQICGPTPFESLLFALSQSKTSKLDTRPLSGILNSHPHSSALCRCFPLTSHWLAPAVPAVLRLPLLKL